MAALSFEEARACVLKQVAACRGESVLELAALDSCFGRVLARGLLADRDYPALSRSIRDGFAVRSADFPGRARVIGEIRAGETANLAVTPGAAVEIMTGAPVPPGADAVIMVEHTSRDGDWMISGRTPTPGEFINPKGAEARLGDSILKAGERLDYASIAAAAMTGCTALPVYARPRVAILATGDEIVPVHAAVGDHQIRNSNSYSLAAQVSRAGGCPEILPVARDTHESTRAFIERGLEADLLLLSGGVSAGKYDIVEHVLSELGAEFYFDRVRIQPGQPLVFGRAQGKFFFGLPGNPASTMVTFELFGRAAVELLGGARESALPLTFARLTTDFRHKAGLTRFLPARLSPDGGSLTPIQWQGSSDVPSLARANAFLVAEADCEQYRAGDWIRVLLK